VIQIQKNENPPVYYVFRRSIIFFVYDAIIIAGIICIGAFLISIRFPLFFFYDVRFILIIMGLTLLIAIGILISDIFRFTTKLTTTPNTVLLETGFITKHTTDIPYYHINAVHIEQTFLGRIFDTGDVIITSGNDISKDYLYGIQRPSKLRTIIYEHKRHRILFRE
jgi:membrane protein YdbS with pleckstrin-like domain